MVKSTKKSKRTAASARAGSNNGKGRKQSSVDMARIRRILQADKERHPEKWTDALLAQRMAARQRKKENAAAVKERAKAFKVMARQMLKEQRAGLTIARIKVPKYFVDQVNSYKWLAKWRGPKWTRFLYLVKRASEQPEDTAARNMREEPDENWLDIATRWRNYIERMPVAQRNFQYKRSITDALWYIDAGNIQIQLGIEMFMNGAEGVEAVAQDRRYGKKAIRKLQRMYTSIWNKTGRTYSLFQNAQRVVFYFVPSERLMVADARDADYIVPGWLFTLWRVKLHQEGLRKPRTRTGNTINAKANMMMALRTFKERDDAKALVPHDALVENLCIELLRKYFIQGAYTLANARKGVHKLFKEFHSMEVRITKDFGNLYVRAYQLIMYVGVLFRLHESRMGTEWIVPSDIRSNNVDDYIAAIKQERSLAKQGRLRSIKEKTARNAARRAELLALSNARRQTASVRPGNSSRGSLATSAKKKTQSNERAGSTGRRSASRSPNRTQSAVVKRAASTKASAAGRTQHSASRLAGT